MPGGGVEVEGSKGSAGGRVILQAVLHRGHRVVALVLGHLSKMNFVQHLKIRNINNQNVPNQVKLKLCRQSSTWAVQDVLTHFLWEVTI